MKDMLPCRYISPSPARTENCGSSQGRHCRILLLQPRQCRTASEDQILHPVNPNGVPPVSGDEIALLTWQAFRDGRRIRTASRRGSCSDNRLRRVKSKRATAPMSAQEQGTPSSIAALIVHRPSPESDTRPAYLLRFGSSTNADAVRSNSHDAITLPRRHTSVTSRRLSSYW